MLSRTLAKAAKCDKGMATKSIIAEVMWIAESQRAMLFSGEERAHDDKWEHDVPLRCQLDTTRNTMPRTYSHDHMITKVETLLNT
jgi:hypothetical protein